MLSRLLDVQELGVLLHFSALSLQQYVLLIYYLFTGFHWCV